MPAAAAAAAAAVAVPTACLCVSLPPQHGGRRNRAEPGAAGQCGGVHPGLQVGWRPGSVASLFELPGCLARGQGKVEPAY